MTAYILRRLGFVVLVAAVAVLYLAARGVLAGGFSAAGLAVLALVVVTLILTGPDLAGRFRRALAEDCGVALEDLAHVRALLSVAA